MRVFVAMGISTILLTASLPVVAGASAAEAAPPPGKGRIVTIPLTGSDGSPSPAAVAGLERAAERASEQARGRVASVEEALRTEPLETDAFVVAGLTWDDADALPDDALIQVRVQERNGWSDWLDVAVEDGGPDGTESGGTDPFITGGATGIQVRVDGERLPGGLELTLIPEDASGSDVTVTDPEVATVLPDDEDATENESVPEEAGLPPVGHTGGGGVGTTSRVVVPGSVPAAVPVDGVGNIISRAEWGADEAYTTSHWTQKYAPLRAAVVHHTAGTNTYTAAQSAGIVRAIFTYHAVTRDWGDIGYNFLVDKYGYVFEGRQGSLQAVAGAPKGWLVEAGHARGYNRGSLGISAMGDFTLSSAPDPTQIISAMARVIAWKFREANLDAGAMSGFYAPTTRTYTSYAAGQELPRIFGHGDVAATSCPGRLYGELGDLRNSVRGSYQRAADVTPSVPWVSRTIDGRVAMRALHPDDETAQIYYTADGSEMYWSPAYVVNSWIANTRYEAPLSLTGEVTLATVSVDTSGNTSHTFKWRAGPTRVMPVFLDVPAGHAFEREISWLASERVTTGWVTLRGLEFRPVSPVNRDAMAAFLYRLAGEPTFTPAGQTFVDVPPGFQFYKEIEWLASTDIATGYNDGTFRPAIPVNRDAMAAFLYRFDGEPEFTAPAESPFTDVTTQAQFYHEITWLVEAGVSTGWTESDGSATFRPSQPINRDAMAAFLYRMTNS